MKKIVVKNLKKRLGDIQVIDDVSLIIFPGKITGLIGPNGAGKTTIFHLLTGTLKPDNGKILLDKKDITGKEPWKIAKMGTGRLFQDVRVFPNLSVLENVIVSCFKAHEEHPLYGVLHTRQMKEIKNEYYKKAEQWLRFVGLENEIYKKREDLSFHLKDLLSFPRIKHMTVHHKQLMELIDKYYEKAKEWLRFVGLEGAMYKKANELSFGQQKLLSFARLMAADSDILLLDEPTAGIHPDMIKRIEELLVEAKNTYHKTIAIIEHNMSTVLNIADFVYFLSEGKVKFSGRPDHVLGEQVVMQEYMGF